MSHILKKQANRPGNFFIALILSILLPAHFALAAPKDGKGKPGGSDGGSSSKLIAPTGLSTTPSSGTTIQINWVDTNSSEQGYKIERRSNGSQFSKITSTAADSVSYTDTGLSSGTTYDYRIMAEIKPAKNSSGYSEISSATTIATDNEAPTVSLVNPEDGNTYETSQTINVSAIANDNAKITKVEFFKDSVLVYTDNDAPYEFDWGIAAIHNGIYTLKAKAYDDNNNTAVSAESQITVNIDTTPPSVSITSPVDNAKYTTAQTIFIDATTSDNDAVAQVEFYLNGVFYSSVSNTPFTTSWSFDSANNGDNAWTAKALDNSGNETISSAININIKIDDVAPTISLTSPTSGQTLTTNQQVSINASTSDNFGVVKVDFLDKGVVIATDTLAPFSHLWDVTAADNGSHNWTAVAFDAAGNNTSSNVISNTVNIDDTLPPVSETDILVTSSGKLGPTSNINMKGRMADFEDITALIYRKGYVGKEKWLFMRNDAGNETRFLLPGLDNDEISWAEYVLTSATDLWLFSSNGIPAFNQPGAPAVARHYQLTGSGPLPDTAVLIAEQSFGGANSAAISFMQLKSGALLGVWYDAPENPSGPEDNYIDVNLAYFDQSGVWSSYSVGKVDALANHYNRVTVAQHPADDSIWLFSKADSFSEIWAIHVSEDTKNSKHLTVDWVDNAFISRAEHGSNGPEGELPRLFAVPDDFSNTIVLAYQNKDYNLFSANPFVKGAYVTLADIDTLGNKNFIRFETYIERVDGLGGLVVEANGDLVIAYRPIDTQTLTFDSVYSVRYGKNGWGTPQFLGVTADEYGVIEYGSSTRAEFALSLDDYSVHLLRVE